MKRLTLKNNKGFTLIELIVVMAVISILVLLAMPKFMGYTDKARATEVKNNIKQLENASERYYIDNQDWPRASDTHYTKEQLESYAKEIKNKTGQTVTLDLEGKYYSIDYDKLQKYVQKPKNDINYIIQNPVGEVYYLDNLTETGKSTLTQKQQSVEGNKKPVAAITMTPEQDLTTTTNITWSYANSTDPDGDAIINVEWQNKQDIYSTEGTYTVLLRVQDEYGLWSDWVNKEFYVMNSQGVKQIATIGYHTVALLNNGTIKAWGYNHEGQLGDGTTTDKTTPTAVTGLTNVKQISVGNFHTVAILNDGTVKAWGRNSYGQLGDGTTTDKATPTIVNGLTNVKQISAGNFHTVALSQDGTVKAWGYNRNGQLGDGTTTDKATPTIVSGLANVKQIVAGDSHIIALLQDGTVKAWGYNGNGQLGDGTTINKTTPTTIVSLTNVKQIVAGVSHTVALLNDGTVKAWGRNREGQLGDGTTTDKTTPTTIVGLTNVKQISAGFSHTIALLDDGTVKAWGYNSNGQLGDGTTIQRNTPTIIEVN